MSDRNRNGKRNRNEDFVMETGLPAYPFPHLEEEKDQGRSGEEVREKKNERTCSCCRRDGSVVVGMRIKISFRGEGTTCRIFLE